MALRRGPRFSFTTIRQPSVESATTPTTEWSGTGATTPSECHSQSPGVLLPLQPDMGAEGSPLLFLEPVVGSDPALVNHHQRSASIPAKPHIPSHSASNTPERLSTPASSISSSSKRGKKTQKQTDAANNGNLEGPRKRRKITRPKRAGMDGQLFITFGPTPIGDSAMSTPAPTPTDSQGNASGRASAQPMDVDATERRSSLGTSIT